MRMRTVWHWIAWYPSPKTPGTLHQGRKEDLAAEARLLREDAHRLALDRAERSQRAAALRAKFGALRCKHAGAADDDGQPRSQARAALKTCFQTWQSAGSCTCMCACVHK